MIYYTSEYLLKHDVNNIINKNTSKLQLQYVICRAVDLLNAKYRRAIKSINDHIAYIRNNEEIFD